MGTCYRDKVFTHQDTADIRSQLFSSSNMLNIEGDLDYSDAGGGDRTGSWLCS